MTVSAAAVNATTQQPNVERRLRALRRANFRMIEAELYNYRWSKSILAQALRELNVMADSTVMAAPTDEPRVQTSWYLNDIVFHRAEELIKQQRYTAAALRETARRLEAIEYMLRRLDQDPEKNKRRLIEMRYFDGRLSDEAIRQELAISESTFRRWRREAVELVAERLGVVV